MTLAQLLDRLAEDQAFTKNVRAWVTQPVQHAHFCDVPETFSASLKRVLSSRGIRQLYHHQRRAIDAVLAGDSVTISTPTASGKSLCYTLPILERTLREPESRALLIFPTKALAQDQRAEFQSWVDALEAPIGTYTYDGDTSAVVRRTIRSAGHVVLTNPDMLHTGILPHHTKWVKLFENLKYVVIDELHTYKGVFGSHVANVLRRLKRIARFYGSDPIFITCSATIRNPDELARRLTGTECQLIRESGAPRAEKHIVFYNPPVVNTQLGMRQSALIAARTLVRTLVTNRIQTIVFARSRLRVEVLLAYLREDAPRARIRGYRGGYLPRERRAIEKGLRRGEIDAVVATNALELGIDIGSLESSVLVGYPGSIASTWQQMGRSGRTDEPSLSILIASSSPLDQHIINHPDYFFDQSPEAALINPDNLIILVSHLKCAAFELPFTKGDRYGGQSIDEILQYLEEHRILHRSNDTWHWMAASFPANEISLRSAAPENVVIVDISHPQHQVIGEVDQFSAPLMVHEGAIYLHESRQYQVEELDFDDGKAYVREVDVNYYTDASLSVDVRVLDEFSKKEFPAGQHHLGEVQLTAQPTLYKKIRYFTHENIGWGRIHLPPREMHTSATWTAFAESFGESMGPGAMESALVGLSHLMREVAPLYLSCDRNDLYVVPQVRSPFTERPTLYLCDAYPGGIGLAERCHQILDDVFASCQALLEDCECDRGCPSCVGAAGEVGGATKSATHQLLSHLVVNT